MIKVNINKQIGCKTFLFPDKQPHINIDGVNENDEVQVTCSITDDGTKISATGLLCVVKENNEYKLLDKVNWEKESQSELKTVFKDGKLIKEFSLAEIRTNAEC
jgi:nicotinamide phosphoribosyltransferase